MANMIPEDKKNRTIYVGNLSREVTDNLLENLFQNVGQVVKIHLHRDNSERETTFAFIEFAERSAAITAQTGFNGVKLLEREIKVGWPTGPGVGGGMVSAQAPAPVQLPTEMFSVYVGDLSQDVTDETLRQHFQTHGNVLEAKVIMDNNNGMRVSRGYGFVAFGTREEAEMAISKMNGQWVGQKQIRVNWASRKAGDNPTTGNAGTTGGRRGQMNLDDVMNQSSQHVSTIYVGGITPSMLGDELLRSLFSRFGTIHETKVFRDKGYGFIKFSSHDEAGQAIVSMHGTTQNGQLLKCSWGKELAELQAQRQNQPRGSRYGNQNNQGQNYQSGQGQANSQYSQGGQAGQAPYGDMNQAMISQMSANGYYPQAPGQVPAADPYAAYYAAYGPYAAYYAAMPPGAPYAAAVPGMAAYNPAAYAGANPYAPPADPNAVAQQAAAATDPNAAAMQYYNYYGYPGQPPQQAQPAPQ